VLVVAEAVLETAKAAGMFISALKARMLIVQLAGLSETSCSVLKGGDALTNSGSRQQQWQWF
jgi:hypothetical protein